MILNYFIFHAALLNYLRNKNSNVSRTQGGAT